MSDDPSPPPPPAPYQPRPATQQAPRNGLGITALILGIVGVLFSVISVFWAAGILGIIGLILGLAGHGRARRGEADNWTMTVWGMITSVAAVVVAIVGTAFSDQGEEPPVGAQSTVSPTAEFSTPTQVETAPNTAENIYTGGVQVGDCLAEANAEGTFSVETVPCSEPHSHEVYASASLPEGDGDFPGYEAIDAQAQQSCSAEFESFVGLRHEQSMLEFRFLTPSEQTWENGDRTFYCAIYDPAGNVTGSLHGAER